MKTLLMLAFTAFVGSTNPPVNTKPAVDDVCTVIYNGVKGTSSCTASTCASARSCAAAGYNALK